MKKITIICACIVFFSALSNLYAHPPTDIKITFDSNTKMLKAVIEHNTRNVLNHYIKTVNVELNGIKIISHNISREDNNNTQTVVYLIPDVKKGDIISVEAFCNIRGSLKKPYRIN